MTSLKRIIHSLLLFVILLGVFASPASADSTSFDPPPAVMSILSSMTPEERVGQLFLVTFTGTDINNESAIYDLIARHHIGGVVLLSSNDNFTAAPATLTDLQALINGLQQTEWGSSQTPLIDPETEQPIPSTYVPLMVGITREGSGSVSEQILNGLTPLPSEMAIGAAWNTDLAAQVGGVQGQELSALGFNLILGPSLDVLESPATSTSGDLGTLAFGGDPYWVGEMGRAYISGLHSGSGGRLLVVARHFPGRGGSNRLPEDEIPTIRKSLEQLKQIELAPFFDITGNAGTPEATADGLLISHIRYQGFQGNIRATTRPVSFDAQALTDILALPEFSAWYSDGGMIVSDDIGTRSVYEFYTLSGDPFSAPFAARDAFLAGNDMIYLGKIQAGDSSDTYTTTVAILEFFAQKYNEDPAFAQRVDTAAARILTKKYNLYGNFAYTNVYNSANIEELIGGSSDITFNVARNAATLVSPEPQDLATVFPSPPQLRERVVFITDTTMVKQCSVCVEQPTLGVDALQQTVLRLYGPESGNQTSDFRLSSHSFQNLYDFLEGLQPPFIENDLTRADWIVISITGSSLGQPALVSRFIRERPELVRDKRIILFSFGAPYYFDSTDLSNITAYFALYSHEPPFVDVAARLLFKELTPGGASPVSIPAVGYDLISAMTPDPDQVISLTLDLPPVPVPTGIASTPEPTPNPIFRIGDTIAIRTGTIRDHNGHPVPDGTVVRFSMVLTGEGGGILQQVETTTLQGVARTSFGLDKTGLLEIRAVSEPAIVSNALRLDVSQSGAVVTIVPPELTEPAAPIPTTPAAPPEDQFITTDGYPRINAWIISMLLISFSVWVGYWLSRRFIVRRAAIRVALGMLVGGLLAYNYLVLGMPGGTDWLTANGLTGALFAIIFGELVGFGVGWFWSRRQSHEQ